MSQPPAALNNPSEPPVSNRHQLIAAGIEIIVNNLKDTGCTFDPLSLAILRASIPDLDPTIDSYRVALQFGHHENANFQNHLEVCIAFVNGLALDYAPNYILAMVDENDVPITSIENIGQAFLVDTKDPEQCMSAFMEESQINVEH